jgi:CheY-like chemotaxis protein
VSLPTPTTSAAALLAQAQARFQASVARTATAVAVARARVSDDAESADALAALETELRRVQGWAASFGMRELKQQAGQLATRVRRWADDPALDRAERVAILGGEARRLAVLATETPRRLPVAAPRAATLAAPEPPSRPAEPEAARVVLADAPDAVVVQDDARMARLLMFALEQSGLSVTAYDSGSAALDALRGMRASPGRPLVILDVELPGLDGHDVHETLRAERPGMFSFVFTAAPMSDGERMRAMNAGALDYLMRPINLGVLMAKIPRWLRSAAPRSASLADRRQPVIVGRRRIGVA